MNKNNHPGPATSLRAVFLGFINEQQLFDLTDCILLAVSGGLDSVVMANLCAEIGLPFGIAHVNFGLRGVESDADEVFVRELAAKYAVPFYTQRFDTADIANQTGVSIQMAARQLRYDFFEQTARNQHYTAIATAHHRDDALETVLLNLVRGTGLAGLTGIPVRRDDAGRIAIVRPMLCTDRARIEAYAEERGLVWREDASNESDKYARNKIRHQVIPVLRELNPNLTETLADTLERLRGAAELVADKLHKTGTWHDVVSDVNGQPTLNREVLLQLPNPLFLFCEWLKQYGFNYDQAKQIFGVMRSQTIGQTFASATHRAWNDRDGLIITPIAPAIHYEIVLNEWPADGLIDVAGQFALSVRVFDKPTDYKPNPDPAVGCFNADRLHFPITIRPWQLGDRFRPLGMDGQKLVSDLLNDRKISLPNRERVAVLLSGDRIVWVIGLRIGHEFRVTSAADRICEIQMLFLPAPTPS
jgi:tRNA(Ile)-lysidine synthase